MRALLPLALLLAASPAVARTHVLALGNDQGRPDEVALRFATRDAELFTHVMRTLGGAQAADVVLLTNGTADEARATLATLRARLAASPGENALVVYYSGHADAHGLHLGESTLPYAELRATVAEAPAAVRVLILDGCRSGGLTRVKGARAAEPFAIDLEDRLSVEGLAVMTSSAAGEDSHESDELQGSFFTHHLLAALIGAGDADRDGRVTLSEAYAYAFRNTLRSSGRTERLQHPTYAYDLKGRGDFVLTRLDQPSAGARLLLADAATYLVRDGGEDGPLRAEVRTEEAGVAVVVAPGSYFVQQRHRDHYREYRFDAAPGQVVDLTRERYRRVAYARLVRKGAVGRSHGLYALGAADGGVLAGRGLTAGAILGYSLDLPWATFGLRGRFGRNTSTDSGLASTLDTLGLGLTFERFVDFRRASLAVGLLLEGQHLDQTFDLARAAEREAWGMAFGGLIALEVPLFDGLALRAEAGPVTHLLQLARVENGAQSGSALGSRFTWHAALGVGVRF